MKHSKNIYVHTPLVFAIHSCSDKTFFFATCVSDEHCSMDATVTLLYTILCRVDPTQLQVTAVCLCIYTLLGTTIESWKILLGPWKSPGIFWRQESGNRKEHVYDICMKVMGSRSYGR